MAIKEALIRNGFYEAEKESNEYFYIKNSYDDNFGYISVYNKNFFTVLIKGTFKNFILKVKNSDTLDKNAYMKIAEAITSFEREIDEHLEIKVFFEDNKLYLLDFKALPKPKYLFDRRENTSFTPLTNVEYSLFHDGLIKGKTLYLNGFFNNIFPETLSPFSASLFKIFEEVLNPFFAENDIKTLSPSIKHIFNKPYINLDAINLAYFTLKSNEHFFLLNFAPHLYLKLKKVKFKDVDLDILREKSIEEFFKDIDENINKLTYENLLENLFFIAANMFAVFAVFFFKFTNHFLQIYNKVENLEVALKLIYLTRNNSLLKKELELYPFFDFNIPKIKVLPFKYDIEEIEVLIKNILPKSKYILGKNKIIKNIKEIHNLLEIRDKMIIKANEVFDKIKSIINEKIDELCSENKLRENLDIRFFDINSLNDLINDNYFANYIFNYTFKKWQYERFSLQITPTEIFEEDIPETQKIISNFFEKNKDKQEFKPLIFFEKERKGDLTHINSLEKNEKGEFCYSRGVSLPMLKNINDYDCVIVESAPLFSYLIEYATIFDKTVITGLRNIPLILKGKKLHLKNGILRVLDA